MMQTKRAGQTHVASHVKAVLRVAEALAHKVGGGDGAARKDGRAELGEERGVLGGRRSNGRARAQG